MNYNICYATDNNYAHIAATSIVSLFENNGDICENIVLWILADNLSKNYKKLLSNLCNKYHSKVNYIEIQEKSSELKKLGVAEWNNGSFTTYARLFLPEMLPSEIDKILYIDSDTLVLESIADFFDIYIEEDKCILGVLDIAGACNYYLHKNIKCKGNNYINAGVVMIDVKKWRRWKTTEKFIDHIKNVRAKYFFPDQDMINCLLDDKIQIVSPKYDYFSLCKGFNARQLYLMYVEKGRGKFYDIDFFARESRRPVIVHFVGLIFYRPWIKDSNSPYTKEWCEYLALTGLKYQDIQKESQPKHLHILEVTYRVLPRNIFCLLYRIRRNFVNIVKYRKSKLA